jgi:hypothetical protein
MERMDEANPIKADIGCQEQHGACGPLNRQPRRIKHDLRYSLAEHDHSKRRARSALRYHAVTMPAIRVGTYSNRSQTPGFFVSHIDEH